MRGLVMIGLDFAVAVMGLLIDLSKRRQMDRLPF